MTRYMRERGFDDLRRAVALVGRGPRGLLGRRSGIASRSASGCEHGARRRARCRARSGSRARRSTTPSTRSAAATTTRVAIVARRRAARARPSWTWGELRAQVARIAAGLRALRRRARRPRRRLHAEHPRDRSRRSWPRASLGAVWSSCSPDFGARSVIDRFAQIEPKVLLAVDGYRYNGKRLRPRARPSPASTREVGGELVTLGYLDGSGWQDGFLGDDARARVRARPVRPPAVGPLLLRHDRAAEGDRPGPGRDPARAPQDAAPARRRAGRRPPLLVHDDRLDDVELPRRRPAHRRVDRALRRQPRAPGHGRAVGPRGVARGVTTFGTSASLHRRRA